MSSVSCNRGSTLVAAIGAVAFVFAPAAAADPGSPSYGQGKQAIDEQVQQYHVQLSPSTDLNQYCQKVLMSDLKSGKIARVDSGPDFIAGCQDEGRALLAPQ
ncbi:hypothetical protein [Mycobacterium montefiorense]|uniref:Secreted protein n=1 Tax=Mycobacterium montefiorense TaxID=154654 RepID=A0AA37PMI7_9MYCO|nr:hypothetical protein NJB14191_27950 [Mycobacterium montefiorense]GKU45828.1 hypothetical protein NJB14194_24490 [Mycobacterium montefiorense]GKU50184.1 hypothetical protein NJB14195_14300 [Mycobacterium montefiorense]GKU62202.1 hypothetical protein NJB18182_27030 [Mycobacterium montefiorense]GKU68992.1 hypothetical protein NJB18183_41380 [Mycobacterium montefiorense]